MLRRYTKHAFLAENLPTIGIDFAMKNKYVSNQEEFKDKEFKVKIWDTAGMERFRTITHGYYKNSDGIIIVFDITDRASFNHVQNW